MHVLTFILSSCHLGNRDGVMKMSTTLKLPLADRTLIDYTPGPAPSYTALDGPLRERVAYAAVHVVADPLADTTPIAPARLDWEATLAYRRYLWSLGFAVAEAMDTAQRGMGLDWTTAQELIRRSLAEARAVGGTIACGAGTDHLSQRAGLALADVEEAYAEQVGFVEDAGGRGILMASRALAAVARGPDDYAWVYDRILAQAAQPVIIHWLGDMFDPALAGYWGARDMDAATETCLQIIADHADKVNGIKISLLDKDREIAMRRVSGAGCGRPGALQRAAGADAAALAAYIPGADVLLQNRSGVPGLPERSPAALPDGWRAGERALDRSPGRAVHAGRSRRRAARPRSGRRAVPAAAGAGGDRLRTESRGLRTEC